MNTIAEYLPAWNSWIALLLYWLPAGLCAYAYLVRVVRKYRDELAKRAKAAASADGYYYPSLTLGDVVGYMVLTVTPVANLFAAVFDAAPEVFGDFFRWIGRVLNVPLVPKRKDGAA